MGLGWINLAENFDKLLQFGRNGDDLLECGDAPVYIYHLFAQNLLR